MVESKKRCSRCQRLIDRASRVCPFCNQEQVIQTIDGEEREVTEPSPPPTSPIRVRDDVSERRKVILVAGAALGLIATFFVGWIVYALGQPQSERSDREEEPVPVSSGEPLPPDVTLVADGSVAPDIERAYTSRLAESLNEDLPEEFQRRDATALPIAVYQRVVEEERRREMERKAQLVDPREVTQAARPRRAPATEPLVPVGSLGEIAGVEGSVAGQQGGVAPSESAEAAAPADRPSPPSRTKPRPLSQPLPRIVSRVPGKVNVNLTVGSDGEVSRVEVIQGMAGITQQIVNALERWKFQPATVNGEPVPSTYRVEIVIKPNR